MYEYSDIYYDNLTHNIINILRKKTCTIEEITNILNNQNLPYTKEEIFNRLILILSQSGRSPSPGIPEITRTPVIGGSDIYTYLDYERGKIAKYYRNIKVKTPPKAILHISDFHYGKWTNPKDIEKNKIIQTNIHNYALKKGIEIAFINGDIFDRIKLPKIDKNLEFISEEDQMLKRAYDYLQQPKKQEEVKHIWEHLKQIFKYSMPNDSRLKYYSIIGNHDKTINALLICLTNQDLRQLSLLNPNFYMFPYKDCSLNIGNKELLFTHEFYVSSLIRENTESSLFSTIEHVEDLGKPSIKKVLNNGLYSMIICGHMHDAQLSTFHSKYALNNPIYLITPQTTIYNLNSVVAYITYYNYNSLGILESIDIEPLKCTNKLEIIPEPKIHHSFIEKKEEYSKVLSTNCNPTTIYIDNKPYTIFKHCFIPKTNGIYYEIIKNNTQYNLKIYLSNNIINNPQIPITIPQTSIELSNITITFNEILQYNYITTPYLNLTNTILNNNLSNIITTTNNNQIKNIYLDTEGNINITLNITNTNKININYHKLYNLIINYFNIINNIYYNNETNPKTH